MSKQRKSSKRDLVQVRERMRRYRARGGGEDVICLTIPVHKWALSDLLIPRFMSLLDRGDRRALTAALSEFITAQCIYGRSTE
jgi:hypothetical protein